MKRRAINRPRGRRSVVLMALSMVALIAGAGLIVDGGIAMSEQRATQNAADSAAKAGALRLAQRAANGSSPTSDCPAIPPSPFPDWDECVRKAIFDFRPSEQGDGHRREYMEWDGNPLGVTVGSGTVPPTAAGVRIVTRKDAWDLLRARHRAELLEGLADSDGGVRTGR